MAAAMSAIPPGGLADVASWLRSVGRGVLCIEPQPKGPCSQIVLHWPQSTYIGTALRPKYTLFGCMDPSPPIRFYSGLCV